MAEETTTTVETLPRLQDMPEVDRKAFLKDGTLPSQKKPTSDGGGEKPTAESGAASEAAQTGEHTDEEQPKPRETRSERRIRQLNDKIKQLESQLNTRPNGNERPSVEQQPVQQSSKAPRLKSFINQVGTRYATELEAHEAWEDATDLFYVEQRQKAVDQALAERERQLEQQKAQATAQKTVETIVDEFTKRQEKFRKTLAQDTFVDSFREVHATIMETVAKNPGMNLLADKMTDSEVGPEMIHYFGQHLDELDALLAMPVHRALAELGKLEISEKIQAPKAKTATAAKRIGSGVGGNGATSVDPVEEAVQKRDVMGYIKAMNAREAAERKR